MRDILQSAPNADLTAQIIAHIAPDVLGLSGFDYDHGGVALTAFADLIGQNGHNMAHSFALRPNSGWQTGLDMDGDGRLNTPDDAQGYGHFAGEKGLAILSRYPIVKDAVRDFSGFLWRDLPDARLPRRDGAVFPSDAVFAVQRLSSTGHWEVPIQIAPGQVLNVLLFQAGPPAFGGQHDRNRNRNHDEIAFWTHLLDGALEFATPQQPLVLMGGANLDPFDGDGLASGIGTLLDHPTLQDPQPASQGARIAATADNSRDHLGPHHLDTVHWPQTPGPGNLRVSYVLPSKDIDVLGSGVFWPAPGTQDVMLLGPEDEPPTRHRLVWVDIASPQHLNDVTN